MLWAIQKLSANNNSLLFFPRTPFILVLLIGVTKMHTTCLQGRLGLTYKRPSYRPTGTHPSPRFVLVWRLAKRSNSLSSTQKLSLCTHWSLMGTIAPPHWDVTRGSRWLVHNSAPCSTTAIGKGSIHIARTLVKPESGSLQIMRMTVVRVIPESGLAQKGILMNPTRAETQQCTQQIMARNSSKPWDTSWWSERSPIPCASKKGELNLFTFFP